MQKRAEDTIERSKFDTFMTGHGTEREDMERRIRFLITTVKMEGFKVWRYKLEDTLFDSRSNDIFGIL